MWKHCNEWKCTLHPTFWPFVEVCIMTKLSKKKSNFKYWFLSLRPSGFISRYIGSQHNRVYLLFHFALILDYSSSENRQFDCTIPRKYSYKRYKEKWICHHSSIISWIYVTHNKAASEAPRNENCRYSSDKRSKIVILTE